MVCHKKFKELIEWSANRLVGGNCMKRVRWGIIGCGQIAMDKMLPAMRVAKDVELVAVADLIAERCDLAKVKSYSRYQDLLADSEIEAVYIALPTGLHLEAVLAAAVAKKAILCEKPLGQNLEEVQQMIQTAQHHQVPLMTAYMSRFGDVFQQACTAVRDGIIGELTFIDANFSYSALEAYPPGSVGGWRWTDPQGGGPLLDIGVYLAFGLRELLGQTITTVNAQAVRTIAPDHAAVPDTNMAWIITEGGIPGVFVATFSHQECRITLYGTKGRLDLTNCFAQIPSGTLTIRVGDQTTIIQAASSLAHFDNYRREIEHFSKAILEQTNYSPSPTEALADAKLLEALKGNSL
jgi:D-xylose 1-dehydrogenase (NADP+, D-xylono-1,5-lactone-forming)